MRFVIRKNSQGKFWWRAVSDGNNEILAASELLSSKATCLHAIEIVQQEARLAKILDKTDEVSTR